MSNKAFEPLSQDRWVDFDSWQDQRSGLHLPSMSDEPISDESVLGALDLFTRYASGERTKDFFMAAREYSAARSIPEIIENDFSLTTYGRKLWPKLQEATRVLSDASRFLGSENVSGGGSVFVVGSAHFDIVARYGADQAKYRDKVGRLSFAVGGTGFHVASHLAQKGRQVALATFLNGGSLTADSIYNAVKDSGIETSYIQFYHGSDESAFVSHVCGEEMVSAVSHMHVETCQFPADLLVRGISSSSLIVADTNLAPSQLSAIGDIAATYARPLFIAAVSEPKLHRIIAARTTATLVAMNEQEFQSSGAPLPASPKSIAAACDLFRTQSLVITRGDSGYSILGASGWLLDFAAPPALDVVSTNGAGDALLAGLAAFYLDRVTTNVATDAEFWQGVDAVVANFVIPALAAGEATVSPFIQQMLPVPTESPAKQPGFLDRVLGRR